MSSKLSKFEGIGLIKPPSWLSDNIQYETLMGSMAYGCANDDSDIDIYGFCIPPKNLLFPHLSGEIPGFGTQHKRFEQYIKHHIKYEDKKYDFQIFSIVKYFHLAMENNPNIIDSLFTPYDCVVHASEIAMMVRQNRRAFLHKGIYFKLKGYAFSQMSKSFGHKRTGKRKEDKELLGFDPKFVYHCTRLMLQAEQVLQEHDLDLTRNKEHLKAIRRGDIPVEEIRKWFGEKEKFLDRLYESSTLRHSPDEQTIRNLLLHCLETHYGSLDGCLSTTKQKDADRCITNIQKLIDEYNS